ncbi:MAG: class I SAM-dependent methyltransferase [Candidatus Omnitrophota bacterium]
MNNALIAGPASHPVRPERSLRLKIDPVLIMDSVLLSLRKRTRQFKRYGYDLPASRRFIWKLSGICHGEVLEIGTGKGHLTALLAQKGLKIISVDLDGEVLKTAKTHLSALKLSKRVSLRKMNAERLRFKSRSFDNVISIDFFHHARNPLRCLREMMRVTRKTLTIADLNQNGMRIMDLVHKSEGKRHETPKIPFGDLKKHFLAHHFNVKSYRHPCHQIFVAQRRSS